MKIFKGKLAPLLGVKEHILLILAYAWVTLNLLIKGLLAFRKLYRD